MDFSLLAFQDSVEFILILCFLVRICMIEKTVCFHNHK